MPARICYWAVIDAPTETIVYSKHVDFRAARKRKEKNNRMGKPSMVVPLFSLRSNRKAESE
jgi:hypothetical protein